MKIYSHAEFSRFASNCGWCRGYGCFQCSEIYERYLNEEDSDEESDEEESEGEWEIIRSGLFAPFGGKNKVYITSLQKIYNKLYYSITKNGGCYESSV